MAIFAFMQKNIKTYMYVNKNLSMYQLQVISKYQAAFGQVQDLAFLPGGEEFLSASEVIRRNATDKGIMAWDFKSTAVLSNQIYQVCVMRFSFS